MQKGDRVRLKREITLVEINKIREDIFPADTEAQIEIIFPSSTSALIIIKNGEYYVSLPEIEPL